MENNLFVLREKKFKEGRVVFFMIPFLFLMEEKRVAKGREREGIRVKLESSRMKLGR